MRNWVKLVAPAADDEAQPPEATSGLEASVSWPGLASPAPEKRDSAAERGGSTRHGRSSSGGHTDMVTGAVEREGDGS